VLPSNLAVLPPLKNWEKEKYLIMFEGLRAKFT